MSGTVGGPAEPTARVAVLTVSDRAAAGVYEDRSGPAVMAAVRERLGVDAALSLCSDDPARLEARLRQLAAVSDLVLTTGGTGVGPRDHTPEVTRRVIDRDASQLLELARLRCSLDQPFAWLSRGAAGVADSCLIINLPGSPRGAAEVFENLADQLPHLLRQVRGEADHG